MKFVWHVVHMNPVGQILILKTEPNWLFFQESLEDMGLYEDVSAAGRASAQVTVTQRHLVVRPGTDTIH